MFMYGKHNTYALYYTWIRMQYFICTDIDLLIDIR